MKITRLQQAILEGYRRAFASYRILPDGNLWQTKLVKSQKRNGRIILESKMESGEWHSLDCFEALFQNLEWTPLVVEK